MAVGCLSSGFLGLTQDGSFFHDKIATHEWEGVSDDPSEGPRIAEAVRKVGDKCNVLLMPNHGFCCFGGSVAEAWVLAYYFEKGEERMRERKIASREGSLHERGVSLTVFFAPTQLAKRTS